MIIAIVVIVIIPRTHYLKLWGYVLVSFWHRSFLHMVQICNDWETSLYCLFEASVDDSSFWKFDMLAAHTASE